MRWLLAVVLVLLGPPARASELLSLVDSGDCPSRAALAAALRDILPDAALGVEGTALEVTDEGDAMRVRVHGVDRRFVDGARRCDERAKKAAVFATLVLHPPTVAVPPPVRGWGGVRAPVVDLDLAGTFAGAPGGSRPLTGGAAAQLYVGGRYVGGIFGIRAQAPSQLHFAGVTAELYRVPLILGARANLYLGRCVLRLDLAAQLAAQRTRGLGVANAAAETRAEFAIYAAVGAAVFVHPRVALALAFQADFVPAPAQLTLPDVGVVGTLPAVWLGALLGLTIRLH